MTFLKYPTRSRRKTNEDIKYTAPPNSEAPINEKILLMAKPSGEVCCSQYSAAHMIPEQNAGPISRASTSKRLLQQAHGDSHRRNKVNDVGEKVQHSQRSDIKLYANNKCANH